MPRQKPIAANDPLPDFIASQLATLVDRAPEGDQWLREIKIDGYRVAARIEHGAVQMLTRHENDWTARFRPLAPILAELPFLDYAAPRRSSACSAWRCTAIMSAAHHLKGETHA